MAPHLQPICQATQSILFIFPPLTLATPTRRDAPLLAADAVQDGWTALMFASWNGHDKCVAALLNAEAEVAVANGVRRPRVDLRLLRLCPRREGIYFRGIYREFALAFTF